MVDGVPRVIPLGVEPVSATEIDTDRILIYWRQMECCRGRVIEECFEDREYTVQCPESTDSIQEQECWMSRRAKHDNYRYSKPSTTTSHAACALSPPNLVQNLSTNASAVRGFDGGLVMMLMRDEDEDVANVGDVEEEGWTGEEVGGRSRLGGDGGQDSR